VAGCQASLRSSSLSQASKLFRLFLKVNMARRTLIVPSSFPLRKASQHSFRRSGFDSPRGAIWRQRLQYSGLSSSAPRGVLRLSTAPFSLQAPPISPRMEGGGDSGFVLTGRRPKLSRGIASSVYKSSGVKDDKPRPEHAVISTFDLFSGS
jgi:hypothetical protein